MYVYSRPEELVETYLESAPTGLVGTVGIQIINTANGAVVTPRTTAGITEIPAGSGAYYAKVTAPGSPGTYSIVWDTGTIGPLTTAADVLVVNSTGAVPPSIPGQNIITLEQVRRAKGLQDDEHASDEKYEDAIAFVSEAIRKYCDRSFGLPLTTGVREYEYDQDGFVDIDDAASIESVEFKIGTFIAPVQPYAWRAEPIKGPPFDYIAIPHWASSYSPEMGFMYNLDVLSRERRFAYLPPTVLVKGTWGWPEVPLDVQQAAILTVINYADDPDENISESIENYSFSRGGSRQFGAAESVAISGRARDLLAPYVRFLI